MKENMGNKNAGITLISLVVTIIVLLILSTVSINVVFSQNGMLQKAELSKQIHANETAREEGEMNEILTEYDNNMKDSPTIVQYVDESLPTAPKLTKGMTAVKYNATNEKWEKVTDMSTAWYNYANKEWANVVLGDSTFNADGTLDESKPYSQLVWIPRFAYQIKTQYHTGTAGDIEVVFINANNKSKDGATTYNTVYPTATVGGSMSDFVVHPAFDYDGKHLTRILGRKI